MPERAIPHLNYDLILKLIEPGSTVLDLGCGDGELLYRLKKEKKALGRGVDIEEAMVRKCIARGLSVFQGNLDEGLKDYETASYDYVILNQTLQVTHKPVLVLSEMLRVGRKAVVSFPNFGYYRLRFQLLPRGQMPVTRELPHQWYDTPNIHLCRQNGIPIERIVDIGRRTPWPNLSAAEVIFILRSKAA